MMMKLLGLWVVGQTVNRIWLKRRRAQTQGLAGIAWFGQGRHAVLAVGL